MLLDPVFFTIVRLQARWRARMTRRAQAIGGVPAVRARDARINVAKAIDYVFGQFDRDGSGVSGRGSRRCLLFSRCVQRRSKK